MRDLRNTRLVLAFRRDQVVLDSHGAALDIFEVFKVAVGLLVVCGGERAGHEGVCARMQVKKREKIEAEEEAKRCVAPRGEQREDRLVLQSARSCPASVPDSGSEAVETGRGNGGSFPALKAVCSPDRRTQTLPTLSERAQEWGARLSKGVDLGRTSKKRPTTCATHLPRRFWPRCVPEGVRALSGERGSRGGRRPGARRRRIRREVRPQATL